MNSRSQKSANFSRIKEPFFMITKNSHVRKLLPSFHMKKKKKDGQIKIDSLLITDWSRGSAAIEPRSRREREESSGFAWKIAREVRFEAISSRGCLTTMRPAASVEHEGSVKGRRERGTRPLLNVRRRQPLAITASYHYHEGTVATNAVTGGRPPPFQALCAPTCTAMVIR